MKTAGRRIIALMNPGNEDSGGGYSQQRLLDTGADIGTHRVLVRWHGPTGDREQDGRLEAGGV